MVTLAFLVFEGVPSPLGVFVRYLRGEESLVGLGVRVALQVLAAFMSYRLVFAICCLEVTAEHQVLLEGSCESDLKVPVFVGCLIEFGSVLYDTWLCHQQLLKSPFLDTIIKNINGALLVCAGVHLTGMYMHPAMATGMTFNCKGTDTLEHIAVYWVASFLGCFAGVRLDSVLRLPRAAADPVAMKKKKDDHDVIQQGQGDRNLRSGNGRGKERARERRQAGGERTSHSNNNNNNNNIKHAKKNKKHN
ncbi:uncharacterized protein LOC143279516 [Babylonia areolata]|uniref:uncharacterized protein LOC143279516 n=1 Tax=Babylonia areolata TaxID=304850 RepID=UPI003FD3D968